MSVYCSRLLDFLSVLGQNFFIADLRDFFFRSFIVGGHTKKALKMNIEPVIFRAFLELFYS